VYQDLIPAPDGDSHRLPATDRTPSRGDGDLIEGVGDAQPPGAHPADTVRGCTQGDSWLSRHALPAGEGVEEGLAVVAGERTGGGGLPKRVP